MNVPALKNINSTLGDNTGGFIILEYWPIEWLAADIIVDPTTRSIITPVQFLPGRKPLQLKCQAESLKYNEEGKTGSSGPYYVTSLSGIANLDEKEKNLQLDTLRLHRLMVRLLDKNGRVKLIGTREYGMDLLHEIIVEQDAAGKSFFDLRLGYEAEHAAPFYEV